MGGGIEYRPYYVLAIMANTMLMRLLLLFEEIEGLLGPQLADHLFMRARKASVSDALRSLCAQKGVPATTLNSVFAMLFSFCEEEGIPVDLASRSARSGKTPMDYVVGNLTKMPSDVAVKDAVVPALLLLQHGAGHGELSTFVAALPPDGALHAELNGALERYPVPDERRSPRG